MIDYQKFIYEYLALNWDQSNYPATIQIHDDKKHPSKDQPDVNILIEIDNGDIDRTALGLKISPALNEQLVFIYLTVDAPQQLRDAHKSYEFEVREELKSVLKAIDETQTATLAISTALDDGYYNENGDRKDLSIQWFTMGRSASNTYWGIFIFQLPAIFETISSLLTISSAYLRVNVLVEQTSQDEGFNIYLIDSKSISYVDDESGVPSTTGSPILWVYQGGTGWKNSTDIATLVTAWFALSGSAGDLDFGITLDAVYDGVNDDSIDIYFHESVSWIPELLLAYKYKVHLHLSEIMYNRAKDRLEFWLLCREID